MKPMTVITRQRRSVHHAPLLTGLGLLAALVSCTIAPRAWQPFTAADTGFTADFPGKPVVKSETDGDGVVVRTYSMGPHGDEYGVVVWDFPDSIDLGRMSDGQIVKLLKQGFLAEFKGQELVNDYCQLGGRRARDIQIESAEDGRVFIRLLLDGQRIYAALASHTDPVRKAEDREKFFGSFRLTATSALAESALPPDEPAETPEEAPVTPAETSAAAAAPAAAAPPPVDTGEPAPPATLAAPDSAMYGHYVIHKADGDEMKVDWFEIAGGSVIIAMHGGEFRIPQKEVVRIEGAPRGAVR